MTFGFVAPAALALGALVGLPVLAHLTLQRPTDRVPFGAMLLVQRLVKRLRRRRSLKDVLLLALRVAAVLFVVLATAGPRLSWQGDVPDVGGSGRVVIVVDTSMSMALYDGGGTLLARARAKAAERVESLPDGVLVGLIAYAEASRVLTAELTDDRARVLAALDTLEPSPRPGDLQAALLDARRLLDGEPGEVVLYTDEAGPDMIPAATEEIGRLVAQGSAVIPEPVHAEPPRNVAVLDAAYGDGIEGGQVTVRAASYGPSAVEVPCEVTLPDGAVIPVFLDVPPEGVAEARVTVPRSATGGVGTVHCADADLALDDRRWFHLPHVGASRVLVVDGDPGDTPVASEVYFLERALAPWGGLTSGVVPDVVGPKGVGTLDPSVYGIVFLANVSDPRPLAPSLRDFVRRGGAVVISVGSNVTAERYNAALGPLLPSPFRRPTALADRGEAPVPLELPDPSLPLFEPFARGGRGAFGRVGSWQVMTLDPFQTGGDVTTLLAYRGGVPALIERRFGAGRVVVWTSSIDGAWSNLPFQAAFLPLVQRLVRELGGESGTVARRLDAFVGDRVEVDLEEGVFDAVVAGPSGEPVSGRITGSRLVFTPGVPGAYTVAIPDGPPLALVAVNVDTRESDVRRTHSVARAEAAIDPDLFTRHHDLGGAALLASLALMMGAALLGAQGGAPP